MNTMPIEGLKDAAQHLAAGALRNGFRLEALHEYSDADGSPSFWRMRLKHPATGEKWIRPMRQDGPEYVIGEPPAPATGKPLYHLPKLLAASPDVIAYVVEGEACADVLSELGLLATTSGSSSSAVGADWAPLRGRRVRLWPDNDAPGAKYATDVAQRLRELGCLVELIDVAALGLPAKGDCVDWLAANPDADAVAVNTLAQVQVERKPVQAITPESLPDPLPAVPAFNAALLPDAVRAWCVDAADGLQIPLDFTAIPAVIALAGALGRQVAVKMKVNAGWYELPILWGCVIGRPSSGKSPALAPAQRLLGQIVEAERKDYLRELLAYQGREMLADARKADAKDKARRALKKGQQVDAASLAKAAHFAEEAPSEPRIVVNDATVEKLGELLNANPRGLVQFRDELAGWLASLDREGREMDRAFWLECWNGAPYTVDRIGRGTIHIAACAVSILGGMQPGKLAEYVRGAVRGGFSDDGLMQRFQLMVYPDLPASWRYTDRALDRNAEDRARFALQHLRDLNPEDVGAEHDDGHAVPYLRLSNDAQAMFIEWYEELMQRLRAGGEPPFMESHLAKYPALAGRLALVLHLADNGTGPVSADAMARALGWCEYLEGHARRIYAPAMDDGTSAAHLLLRKRESLPESFTARDVYRKHWSGLDDPEVVTSALETLTEYRHLVESIESTGGRPTAIYRWMA